jgi:hypothetical protein
MRVTIPLLALIGGLALAFIAVLTLQRPPAHIEQIGYRGTGAMDVSNPAAIAASFAMNQAPAVLPQNNAGPPRPGPSTRTSRCSRTFLPVLSRGSWSR